MQCEENTFAEQLIYKSVHSVSQIVHHDMANMNS